MKIKHFFLLLFFWINLCAVAQRTITPTDSLRIFGEVKNPITFSLAELDTFPESAINDQIIYNHNGEVKDTLTGMIGIPLKTLLGSIEYIYAKPKELNEFYFIFTASDGYKVVFSWNEIYNSHAGNQFFILTEMEGKKIGEMNQRIVFISTADLQTGRRYIKGLEKIEVRRIS